LGWNLRRLAPPKLRLLGYQRMAISLGLNVVLVLLADSNIVKSFTPTLISVVL
jgi:hypothetical protein